MAGRPTHDSGVLDLPAQYTLPGTTLDTRCADSRRLCLRGSTSECATPRRVSTTFEMSPRIDYRSHSEPATPPHGGDNPAEEGRTSPEFHEHLAAVYVVVQDGQPSKSGMVK